MAPLLRQRLCAVLSVLLTACSTLRPVAAPQQFIPTAQPTRIWVTQADNSTLMLEAPRLLGDTLVGFVGGRYQEMLLPQVRWMGVRQPAPRRTTVLVAGLVFVGAGLIAMLASSGPGGGPMGGEDPSNPSSLLLPFRP
ncbi:MAG TPA: hypothetical protein VGQ18_09905 [Gemmatimonadales bacterium]|jgi:hypothetical protein|nr:hypothetical protein [Gemmatimonadales bacterium]